MGVDAPIVDRRARVCVMRQRSHDAADVDDPSCLAELSRGFEADALVRANTVLPEKTAANARCGAVVRARRGGSGPRTATRQRAIGSPPRTHARLSGVECPVLLGPKWIVISLTDRCPKGSLLIDGSSVVTCCVVRCGIARPAVAQWL